MGYMFMHKSLGQRNGGHTAAKVVKELLRQKPTKREAGIQEYIQFVPN